MTTFISNSVKRYARLGISNNIDRYARLGLFETICFKYTDNNFYFYRIDRIIYAENNNKDIVMNIWT